MLISEKATLRLSSADVDLIVKEHIRSHLIEKYPNLKGYKFEQVFFVIDTDGKSNKGMDIVLSRSTDDSKPAATK